MVYINQSKGCKCIFLEGVISDMLRLNCNDKSGEAAEEQTESSAYISAQHGGRSLVQQMSKYFIYRERLLSITL